MKTTPFNESHLWKGTLQLSNYPKSVCKPDMVLMPLIYHNGQHLIDGNEYKRIQNRFCHPDGLPKTYAAYSKKYWDGVNQRKQLYRKFNKVDY